jgi:radical SAM protein with 4Fe4S-binding SPASM domain
MFQKKLFPKSAQYELTLQCNMSCLHCNVSAGKERPNELSLHQWNIITKQLAELGCKKIDLLGGEPFVRKDWYEISQTIKDYGMNLLFVTNGSLITQRTIEQLKKLEPHAVAVSIDGATPSTHDSFRGVKGSFEQCQKVIQVLREANLPTTVLTTIHKKNFSELSQMRSQLIHKGIAWQIQLALPLGRFQKEWMITKDDFYAVALFIASTRRKYSLKELPIIGTHCFGYYSKILPNHAIMPNWRGCQAGITSLGIQSDGSVKGCLFLPEWFVQGNVKEQSLFDIWNDSKFCDYTRKFMAENLQVDCRKCKYGKKCKGGCLAASFAITGRNYGDPYCLNIIEKQFSKKDYEG